MARAVPTALTGQPPPGAPAVSPTGISTARNWNRECESYHGIVHNTVEMFRHIIEKLGCACGDVENIIMRMMNIESHGNPNCGSSCIGLMQVSPTTADAMRAKYGLRCGSNYWDPKTNITCGVAAYIDCLRQYHGSHRRATAAYNWGQYRAEVMRGDEHAYRRITQEYVEKALALPHGTITAQGSTYEDARRGHSRYHRRSQRA